MECGTYVDWEDCETCGAWDILCDLPMGHVGQHSGYNEHRGDRMFGHDSASTSSGTTRPAVSDMEPSTTGSVSESSR
jgi:hypothetical protein